MNTFWSWATAAFSRRYKGNKQPMHRLQLYPGELYRIPAPPRQVRVVTGTAYLSFGGKDYIILPNESIKLDDTDDMVLVSPVRDNPLVIEL